jgi:hypothetical protein
VSRTRIVAALLCLFLAACGSTAQLRGPGDATFAGEAALDATQSATAEDVTAAAAAGDPGGNPRGPPGLAGGG